MASLRYYAATIVQHQFEQNNFHYHCLHCHFARSIGDKFAKRSDLISITNKPKSKKGGCFFQLSLLPSSNPSPSQSPSLLQSVGGDQHPIPLYSWHDNSLTQVIPVALCQINPLSQVSQRIWETCYSEVFDTHCHGIPPPPPSLLASSSAAASQAFERVMSKPFRAGSYLVISVIEATLPTWTSPSFCSLRSQPKWGRGRCWGWESTWGRGRGGEGGWGQSHADW